MHPAHPPLRPVLFATGSDDAILEQSRALADATPNGSFVELSDRHHFNARHDNPLAVNRSSR